MILLHIRILGAFCGAFFLFLSFTPIAHSQDYTSDLVSHWKMDETTGTIAFDSAGSNDGTMQNGLNAGADSVAGMLRRAFNYTGANDQRIFVPHDASQLAPTGYGTWSLWFKTDGSWPTSNGGDASLLSKRSSNCASDGVGISLISTGQISASARNGGCWGGDDCRITYTNSSLFNNEWHHVVFTFGKLSTDRSYLYLDGKAVSSCSGSANWNFGSYNFKIGDGECTCEEEFKGKIDDVRIYDRALTSKDVLSLYQARAAGTLRYNDSAESLEYHDDKKWVHTGLGSYSPNAVHFDGSNDRLATTSLANVSDSSKWTGSFWIKRLEDGGRAVFDTDAPWTTSVAFNASGNKFNVRASDGTQDVLHIRTSNDLFVVGEWHHAMFSVDLSDPTKRHLYVDGVSNLNVQTYLTGAVMDFTHTSYSIGALDTYFDVADAWMDFGTYIDLSLEENRRKFISENGAPMTLGENGSWPTGQAPDIFLSGHLTNWATNKGTAGGFTTTGALGESTTQPGAPNLDLTTISGLVGHWRLDETSGSTLVDSSAGGNDLTWIDNTGNDVAEETTTGKIGTAVNFDGVDDKMTVRFDDAPTEQLPALSACSWFKSDINQNNMFFRWMNSGNNTYMFFTMGLENSSGSLESIVRLNDNNHYTAVSPNEGAGYWNSAWHFACVTFDRTLSSDRLKIYVNGNVIATHDAADLDHGFLDTSHTGYIELGDNSFSGDDFNGKIDDVRFYDRALTRKEIMRLHRGECSGPIEPTGTVIFNSTFSIMQYCNGTDWVAMGEIGGTGSGCSDPSGVAGEMIYNEDSNIMQYCDSEDWRGVGKNIYSMLDQGLVGHWRLDETSGTTAIDSSGYGRDGTLVGGMDAGSDSVTGVLGGAFDFDGVDDAVQIPTITLGSTDKWTLSAWLLDDHTAGDGNWIGRNGVSTHFIVHNGGYWYRDSAGAYHEYMNSTQRAAYTNRWTLHTFVGDGAGTIDVYIDGILFSTLSGIADSSFIFNRLGHAYYNANNAAKTGIDDVRLWDRAFNAGEVNALYATYVTPDIQSNLVGHWPLNETTGTTAFDISGNGNDGTMNQDLDAADDSVVGAVGRALRLEGTEQTRIDTNGTEISNLSPLTACLWFNVDSWTNADSEPYFTLLEKGWRMRIADVATTPELQFYVTTSGTYTNVESTASLSLGEWYHACAVHYGVGTAPNFYVNGIDTSTGAFGGNGTQNDDTGNTLRMGSPTLNTYYANFPGVMDDVRLYNRALYGPDITLLYSAGRPSLNDGLVGHWMLDETTGTTAIDRSGNGNNGTMEYGLDAGSDSVTGAIGNALHFDGVDDLVEIPDSALLKVQMPMSTSLWVNIPTLGESMLLRKRGAGNTGWDVKIDSSNRLTFTSFSVVALTSTGTITNTGWHHISTTVDSSGNVNFYLNGDNIGTGSWPSVNLGTAPLRFATNVDTNGNVIGNFDVVLDDVRIYNRVLSASDVQALYDLAPDPCDSSPSIGDVCKDGTVYAGLSPDGNVAMFVADAAATSGNKRWNNGNSTGYISIGGSAASSNGEGNTAVLAASDSDGITAGTQPHIAGQTCADLTANGKTDWYLPASNELNVLYTNRAAIGGFVVTSYWSSTQSGSNYAGRQDFSNGVFSSAVRKDFNGYVRCVRKD